MKQSFGGGSNNFEGPAMDTLQEPNEKDLSEIDQKLSGRDLEKTLSEAHEEANRVNRNIDRMIDWKEAVEINEGIDAKAREEQVEYETVRSAIAAKFEEIKKEVREQTARVKEVEDTDEKQYEERLASLRELEQKRAEAGVFLSRYWGDSLAQHREAEKQFSADVAEAKDLQDLMKRLESWGGLPKGGGGEFLPYSEFYKQIEEVFTAPTNSERARKLQELDVNVEVKGRIIEGHALEATSAPIEYARALVEEKELGEIKVFIHSSTFQSGLGFRLWSLLPSNKRKLDLLNKYNIDYSSPEARRSAATIGTAFKLNEILQKKRDLEAVLPKELMDEIVEEVPVEVLQIPPSLEESGEDGDELKGEEAPAILEAPPIETEILHQESSRDVVALPEEYEGDYEEPSVTPEEIGRISQVKLREENEPIFHSNFGREIIRLGGEEKRLQNLQEVVSSDFFPVNLRFPWSGRKWRNELEGYQIPYKTKREQRDAPQLVKEKLEEVQARLAKVTEAKNTGKKEINY